MRKVLLLIMLVSFSPCAEAKDTLKSLFSPWGFIKAAKFSPKSWTFMNRDPKQVSPGVFEIKVSGTQVTSPQRFEMLAHLYFALYGLKNGWRYFSATTTDRNVECMISTYYSSVTPVVTVQAHYSKTPAPDLIDGKALMAEQGRAMTLDASPDEKAAAFAVWKDSCG